MPPPTCANRLAADRRTKGGSLADRLHRRFTETAARRTLAVLLLASGAVSSSVPPARAQAVDSQRALEPAAVLRALTFDESGMLVGPAARDFWERVFGNDQVPENPERELGRIDPVPLVDAAFVLAVTCTGPPEIGRARLRAFTFVQRVFRERGGADLPAVLATARAVMRYPLLMLSIERMAVEDPRVYMTLARAARRFDGITQPLRLRDALSQFQGAVALVERARLAGTITPDTAGAALLALAAVPMTRDGSFDGAVAGWLTDHLLPRLGVAVTPAFESNLTDQRLLAALAGASAVESPIIDWEGLRYRFDPRLAQFERFLRTRDQLGGNRVDAVLALWALTTDLTTGVRTVADLPSLAERLETSVVGIRQPRIGLYVPETRNVPYAELIRPLVENLREIANRGRSRGLPRVVERLRYIVDVLVADLLRTLPYVVHLANGYGITALGNDIAARHEFGIRIENREDRIRVPWTLPRGRTAPPPPFHRIGEFWIAPDEDRFTHAWHVYGGLMSLDLALSPLYLPRLSGVIPPAEPAFTAPEEEHFAHGVTLFNPSAVTREQVAAIAEAIRRGRARVRRLGRDAAGLPDIARQAKLSAERRNDLAWVLRHRPDALDRFFSRNEMLWLGLRDGEHGRPPAGWGAPAIWLEECLCMRIPEPDAEDLSRAPAERLASRFADLQLALVEAVDDLALPAPIVADLLPLATRELLDGVRATYAGNVTDATWTDPNRGDAVDLRSRRGRFDALVRYVHSLTRARIEDYVATLVGPGRPLRPVE